MESTLARREARERLHRRALSQSSTASTRHTQMTTKSTSSSSSHPREATPLSASHTHRYHHSQYDRGTTGVKSPSRLSRESSRGPKQPMAPVSSLLQERLQQERRAESERLASKFDHKLSSSTGAIRDGDIPSSSSRRYGAVSERRPNSSHGDDSSQSSMGVKQVEKAVSTLHKQNFDLKLELFHRREKQSTLEARIEELESERHELTDIQENLLGELVKRDKAIEEAVNMIVKLEARLDELVQEKEMVRQIEADGSYDRSYRHSLWDTSERLCTETPRPGDHGALLLIEPKTLDRMPSFLSEQSVHTENLRNVVLQNRSSLMHIRKVSQVSSSSAEVSEFNRVASPSLSMLSESSFLSIYGSKEGRDGYSFPPMEDVPGMDGTFIDRSSTPTTKPWMDSLSNQETTTPNHLLNMTPRAMANRSGQALSLNNVLRRNSPIQKLEKLGGQANIVDDTLRPSTSGRGKDVVTPTPWSVRSHSQSKGKQEKREVLHKVLTSYPTHKELANSHTLPPTPDTVASSVLRKHKNPSSSQDSLPSPEDARVPRNRAAPLPDSSAYLRSLASQEARSGMNGQMTLSATPRNRSDLATSGFIKPNQDLRLSDLGDLARSAAETTTARQTARPRSDSFISDSDSDGGADAHSDTETCDYWMRESYKPDGDNSGSSIHRRRGRSPSPDLFSFPVDSGGWEPEAMFGALKGSGFLGSPVATLKRDPIDEMASSLQTPQPDSLDPAAGGPQPPSRRSSLNAHAASQFLLSSFSGKAGRNSSRDGSVIRTNVRGRSNSIDGSGHMMSPVTRADAGSTPKRSQYPPISGLQSRGRGLGLNLLFRRSGSESYGTPASATESTFPSSMSHRGPPAPQAHLRHLTTPSGRNSVPPPATMPWATRVNEDEYQSATPPPIMRNRPEPLQTDLASPDVTDLEMSQAAETRASTITPSMVVGTTNGVVQTTPGAPQGGGGVRKWLGLGRKGSLKNRTG
ncbi:hypothetical protein HD806DRAFT_224465 [Xylariaceae sp. AK1471]|nr:hypothetical protein HD806DRAFT_224465 [Xylariaceae sp. AK1471]